MKNRSLVLLLEAHLAAGGDAVVVGGERLAGARIPICVDDGQWTIVDCGPRFAAPGIRCSSAGRTWFVATASRAGAQRMLDEAMLELAEHAA